LRLQFIGYGGRGLLRLLGGIDMLIAIIPSAFSKWGTQLTGQEPRPFIGSGEGGLNGLNGLNGSIWRLGSLDAI